MPFAFCIYTKPLNETIYHETNSAALHTIIPKLSHKKNIQVCIFLLYVVCIGIFGIPNRHNSAIQTHFSIGVVWYSVHLYCAICMLHLESSMANGICMDGMIAVWSLSTCELCMYLVSFTTNFTCSMRSKGQWEKDRERERANMH